MRLYLVKEAPGQYAAAQALPGGVSYKTIALFRTDRDALRFVYAAERSMTVEEETAARRRRSPPTLTKASSP